MRGAAAVLLAALGVVLAGTVGRADARQQEEIPNVKPDAQIVVLLLPTGEFEVSSVYPKKVPQKDAEARMRTVLDLTKWKAGELHYANESTSFSRKPLKNLSSVSFTTQSGVVDPVAGTLDVAPFIRAFRDLNRIHVTYFLPANFTYRGPREYADKNVDLRLAGGQGTLTYVVNIKNHQLDSVNLPRTQAEAEASAARASASSEPAPVPGGFGGKLALLVAAAAGVGVLIFALTSRVVRR